MKDYLHRLSYILLGIVFFSCSTPSTDKQDAGEDQLVEQLLSRMSLEEKVGQMTQVTLTVVSKGPNQYVADEPHQLDEKKLRHAIVDYHVGSILNTGGHAQTLKHWHEIIDEMQRMSKEDTRLGIPILYGIDGIHGQNYTVGSTLFPQEIGQAATWNPELVENAAAITAYEIRASDIPWNFSPVLGVGRTPLWPRFYETLGEDTYLVSSLGAAIIRGYEGENPGNKVKVASCMKHYMGYSFPLSGKDRTPAWIPDIFLREYFLPPFKAAVDAGASTVMINSGEVNGVPVHASHYMLTEILRDELGFDGVVVTDWADINYLYTRHKVAASNKDAVKQAIEAGVDMSMVPYDFSFADILIELVKEGSIPESRIDLSVRRILRLKHKLGLFDHPSYPLSNYQEFGSKKHQEANLEAARESITLLKNNKNLLPLSPSTRVLITGPTANNMRSLNGGWSYTWQGDQTDHYAKDKHTIYEAIKEKIGDRVMVEGGSTFDDPISVDQAVRKAMKADVVVLCLGETSYTEKPGDIENISLPQEQINLAKELASTGKPVVLVLVEGRPRLIHSIVKGVDAVLMAYLPGNQGGQAIADILFGEVNPSGKLPFTYPKFANSLVPYDHKYTEELKIDDGLDHEGETYFSPEFEFGEGLSYTTFSYDHLLLNGKLFAPKDTLDLSVEVTNSGERAGKEVVQLYMSDLVASITPPVKRLRGFKKILLQAGEMKKVSFRLPVSALSFVDEKGKWRLEPGLFKASIGGLTSELEIASTQ